MIFLKTSLDLFSSLRRGAKHEQTVYEAMKSHLSCEKFFPPLIASLAMNWKEDAWKFSCVEMEVEVYYARGEEEELRSAQLMIVRHY